MPFIEDSASQLHMIEKSTSTLKLEQVLMQSAPRLTWIFGFALVLTVLIGLSSTPLGLTLLMVGRMTGPIQLGPISLLLFLVYGLFLLIAALASKVTFRVSKKLVRNGIRLVILNSILSLIVSFLVMSLFSLAFMSQALENGKIIDKFVAENANFGFQDYVNNVSFFLNDHVKNAYQKPEAIFKIDIRVSGTLLDLYMMQIWGVTRSDVIVYQGWGTCEQAALLIEELLRRAEYQTRLARFIGIDHEWAEVKYNGTWLIVDPWYIGNLAEAQNLKFNRTEFLSASGVEVQYPNGTRIDASHEHGY
jgi:hypothetical protein